MTENVSGIYPTTTTMPPNGLIKFGDKFTYDLNNCPHEKLWDVVHDVDKRQKYGAETQIYGSAKGQNNSANPVDPGNLDSYMNDRRGGAVAFSYIGLDPAFGDTATHHILTPNPMVGISASPRRTKQATFGYDYTINLKGYIVPSGGGPPTNVGTIFGAQRHLLNVVGSNDLMLHVQTAKGDRGIMSFPVILDSINFEPGQYTNYAEYNISLKSHIAISGDRNSAALQIDRTGTAFSFRDGLINGYQKPSNDNINWSQSPAGKLSGGVLEDFQEDWSYEYVTDMGLGQAKDTSLNKAVDGHQISEGYYKVTRNITAVGVDIFNRRDSHSSTTKNTLAWEFAADIVQNYAGASNAFNNMASVSGLFPYRLNSGQRTNRNVGQFEAFNFESSQSINKGAGSCSLTQSWILIPSGYSTTKQSACLESYTQDISTETGSAYVSVSLEGTIKGLSKIGQVKGHDVLDEERTSGKMANALGGYTLLSRSGNFGFCQFYKRAQAGLHNVLNTQPLSISIGQNTQAGEVTYSIVYDNRPSNYFRGVNSENIEIQDTYAGDLYTLVNVIGRNTGPVIQYGAGRTEYRRTLSLDLQLSSYSLSNDKHRSILYSKPSVSPVFRHDLNELLQDVSPASEPGIRKYLMDPPQETWNPTTGAYSLQLSWIYELLE
tara:strand:- start:9982 stop:11964 length:1983 start_codon:yes stop_codon:yes gene_type:complete